jgi:hypothetical protein
VVPVKGSFGSLFFPNFFMDVDNFLRQEIEKDYTTSKEEFEHYRQIALHIIANFINKQLHASQPSEILEKITFDPTLSGFLLGNVRLKYKHESHLYYMEYKGIFSCDHIEYITPGPKPQTLNTDATLTEAFYFLFSNTTSPIHPCDLLLSLIQNPFSKDDFYMDWRWSENRATRYNGYFGLVLSIKNFWERKHKIKQQISDEKLKALPAIPPLQTFVPPDARTKPASKKMPPKSKAAVHK